MNETDEAVRLYYRFQQSPIFFVEHNWGLTPQPIKKDFEEQVWQCIEEGRYKDIKAGWFGMFVKGRHLTWHQWLVLVSVERAIAGKAPKRISVVSGHGVGKTAVLSWLMLWYLFCYKDAQVPCTAPTSEQMHDILWKEVSVQLMRMPADIREKYEWTYGYIRIVESPTTWFARAKTAKADQPEALAGVHGDHVFFEVDEASGVHNKVFEVGEGALTNKDILFVMISNGTRSEGYFYDSHHDDAKSWQTLSFSGEDSPIVDEEYIQRMADKFGIESDEYRVRVKGGFPRTDQQDDKGYNPLFLPADLRITFDGVLDGRKKLGVDPAGTGSDAAVWVLRTGGKAKIVHTEKVTNEKKGAQITARILSEHGVHAQDVTIDNFGVGANWGKELAILGYHEVKCINVGDVPADKERFANIRAEGYFTVRSWMRAGGELVANPAWKEEAKGCKFKRTLKGKLQMMPKDQMRKEGLKSPNAMDALMLTCAGGLEFEELPKKEDAVEPTTHQPTSEYEGGFDDDEVKKHSIFKGVKIGQLGHEPLKHT